MGVVVVKRIGQGVKDFRKGMSALFGKPDASKGGDRRLARVSLMVETTIDSHTKHEVRRRVIKDIEQTLAKEAKKGGKEAVDEKMAICMATPEYTRLLHRLGIEEPHIRIMAMEALKKNEK